MIIDRRFSRSDGGSIMPTNTAGSDQRFLLSGVSWQTYEALLAEVGERTAIHLTYDDGDLEFMSPGGLHDRYKHRFGRMIVALSEVLKIPMDGCGSTTLRRGDMKKGLEPDEAFYIQNEPRVRGKFEMDLEVDPPPDLAIEIDITNSSVDREGIYAALGVPELWRYDGETLRIFRLGVGGKYEATATSSCFPFLPIQEFAEFLDPQDGEDLTRWGRRFRAWVRKRVLPLYRAWRA
jgi:Uma2 family endonuclease